MSNPLLAGTIERIAPAPVELRVQESSLSRATGSKLMFLESIRGLAAFVVVANHLMLAFAPNLERKSDYAILATRPFLIRLITISPLSVIHDGQFAVRLFFVLSGLVLSLSYFQTRNPKILRSAVVRRYFRLMIPVFITVMLSWVTFKAGWYRNTEAALSMHQDPSSWLNFWFQFKMGLAEAVKQGAFGTFFHFDLIKTLNPALWTMPIELVGSFFVFAVLALTASLPRRAVVYTALAFVLYETSKPDMMDFLVGITLCDVFTTLSKNARWPRLPVFPSIAVVGTGLMLGGLRTQWVLAHFGLHSRFSEYWPTAAALMIVGGVLLSPFLQRSLERQTFAFLGRISFPLYLVHSSVICFVGCMTYLHLRARLQSQLVSAWIASMICVAISIFAAWLLYYAADLPAIRFGRFVEQKIFRT